MNWLAANTFRSQAWFTTGFFFYYNYMAILVTISNLHCISRYLCSLFIFIDLNLKIKLQDSNNILSLEKISLLKHHFYMNLARLYNAAKIKKNKTYGYFANTNIFPLITLTRIQVHVDMGYPLSQKKDIFYINRIFIFPSRSLC